MVSAEENGKSKTHKTYRNLEIEYNKKKKKRADREIKHTDSVKKKKKVSLSFHLHALLTRGSIFLLFFH